MHRARRSVAVLLFAGLLIASPVAAQDVAPPVFRVFLTDGTALASYGEWARVDDRVVFSIPLSSRPDAGLQLVTLPAARVDWPRTDGYRDRVRATHYASTRGEADFAGLTADVARTLNEIAVQTDPTARLQKAERARAALASWPAAHYGYKSTEVREIVGMLDEIIGELRAAAGLRRFELSLVADAPPPPVERLMPAPNDQEIVNQLMTAASLSATATERTSLLRTVLSVLDSAVDALPQSWSAELRKTALGRLAAEERVDRSYHALRSSTIAAANRHAAAANVRALERLRASVIAKDSSLGRQRPDEVVAVLATIDAHLDSARRLRLAQDQWQIRSVAYQTYQRAVRPAFETLAAASASLEAIRAMAGPSPDLLRDLVKRLRLQTSRLELVKPPSELAPVHAIIRSAWELSANAVNLRLDAVTKNNIDGAQQASAAAAGALMLVGRARTDLATAVQRPSALR
jgi:hypothetical protein